MVSYVRKSAVFNDRVIYVKSLRNCVVYNKEFVVTDYISFGKLQRVDMSDISFSLVK